jgi:hypothetical protein
MMEAGIKLWHTAWAFFTPKNLLLFFVLFYWRGRWAVDCEHTRYITGNVTTSFKLKKSSRNGLV